MNLNVGDKKLKNSELIVQKNKKNRIDSLDWLRGLMAISIMLYHFSNYSFFELDASSLLGKFSIYAVSIFFVISGLSMAVVYHSFINSIRSAWFFLVRRIFRIWPLLWACVALGTIATTIQNLSIDWWKIFLNITTLFGILKPDAYINTGAWSIGNEMVFYLLTPILIIIFNKKKWVGNFLTLSSCAIFFLFAFYLLKPGISLNDQWGTYINPLNNLFFYITGISIYYNLKNINLRKYVYGILLFISILFFIFFPIFGDRSVLAIGIPRILFSLMSILLVVAFYKFPFTLPTIISYPLKQFGIATYGVYLLHPIIFQSIQFLLPQLKTYPFILFASSIILTITLALLSYKFFEEPLMRIGKKITTAQ